MRGCKNIFHSNGKQKKAGVAIFISNKIEHKIKKIIRDRNYSIVKVATECNIADTTIYNYIKAQRIPSVATLIELANMLNCNIDYLLDRTDNPININNIDIISTNRDIKILMDNILALTDDKRKLVDAYVKGLLNN